MRWMCVVWRAILFTNKNNGQLMQGGKMDPFQKISFSRGIVAAISDGNNWSLTQFASKGNTGSVKNLGCGRSGDRYRIMFAIFPVRYRLEFLLVFLCQFETMYLQVVTENLVGCHTDSEHNTQITVVRQRKIFSNFDADGASHLSCFVASTACNKIDVSLRMHPPRIVIDDAC